MEQAPDFTRATRRLLFGPGGAGETEIPGAGTSAAKQPRRHTKVKVTINLDGDIINFFKDKALAEDLGYQILINRALREYMEGGRTERLAADIANLLAQDNSFVDRLAQQLKR